MKRICVYAGSGHDAPDELKETAARLGGEIASRSIEVVYGGGRLGLMGALAGAALDGGGRVTGVIPRFLHEKDLARPDLTEVVVVDTMHERKAIMARLADAFIALPGGIGTLEEFFEAVTWAQLGLHDKPCGILNGAGYYDGLLRFLDEMMYRRFLKEVHREMIVVDSDPGLLLDRLADFRPPSAVKWPDPGDR